MCVRQVVPDYGYILSEIHQKSIPIDKKDGQKYNVGMEKPAANAVQVNGERVRDLRLAAFLTQRELAEQVGIKIERLSRLENGRQTGMYRTTLRALAEALGVEPGELVANGHD